MHELGEFWREIGELRWKIDRVWIRNGYEAATELCRGGHLWSHLLHALCKFLRELCRKIRGIRGKSRGWHPYKDKEAFRWWFFGYSMDTEWIRCEDGVDTRLRRSGAEEKVLQIIPEGR